MSKHDIQQLLDIMARLRDPNGGCPWDLEQDFATIAPYTIEEAYEVAEAIARGDRLELRDELGLPTPETLPVDEAAARAGVSAKTLRKRLAAGSVAGYRSGATWRVYLHGLISATQQPSL